MSNEIAKIEVQPALKQATDLIITDEIKYNLAADMLKTVKDLSKKVKETFDPICKKANEAHKEATAKRKEHQEPLAKAEKILKDKMLEYSGKNEVQKVAGISTTSKWVANVVDIDKVPRKFLIVDQKALDAIAKASKDLIKIPGVEFKEEKSMNVRA